MHVCGFVINSFQIWVNWVCRSLGGSLRDQLKPLLLYKDIANLSSDNPFFFCCLDPTLIDPATIAILYAIIKLYVVSSWKSLDWKVLMDISLGDDCCCEALGAILWVSQMEPCSEPSTGIFEDE